MFRGSLSVVRWLSRPLATKAGSGKETSTVTAKAGAAKQKATTATKKAAPAPPKAAPAPPKAAPAPPKASPSYPEKTGVYKAPEYYNYDPMSFYDIENAMAKHRIKQPSSLPK